MIVTNLSQGILACAGPEPADLNRRRVDLLLPPGESVAVPGAFWDGEVDENFAKFCKVHLASGAIELSKADAKPVQMDLQAAPSEFGVLSNRAKAMAWTVATSDIETARQYTDPNSVLATSLPDTPLEVVRDIAIMPKGIEAQVKTGLNMIPFWRLCAVYEARLRNRAGVIDLLKRRIADAVKAGRDYRVGLDIVQQYGGEK